MIDPRAAVVETRLAGVRQLLPVTGGKGGIGKTLVAASLAAALAAEGRRTGLLDLDVTSPCAHLVLGAQARFPEEDRGILPQRVAGVDFLSVHCFAGARPAPLRGADVSSALLELLAVTRWGELDTLVVDMPPGLGDVMLDAVRRLPRARFLVVARPQRMVLETVARTLELLTGLGQPLAGVVENMAAGSGGDDDVRALARAHGTEVTGVLPFDPQVEAVLGDPARLLATSYGQAVRRLAAALPRPA